MIETKTKYTYNDVCIVPAEVSSIRHRSQCNVFYEDEMLPLFTAPMNTVVDETNFRLFKRNNIHPILPRTSNIKLRLKLSNEFWCAFSLSEFEQYFVKCEDEENILDYGEKHYVLIDIANGHMRDLLLLIKAAKEKLVDNITIMAGNIANPETYNDLSEAGADYVRIGIGGGHGCFVKDTMITMSDNSLKPIQNIEIGDNVLTLDGSKQVLSKKIVNCTKKIRINDEIECTLDHKFLVINKSDLEKVNDDNLMKFAYYLEAENLDMEKHLLIKNV